MRHSESRYCLFVAWALLILLVGEVCLALLLRRIHPDVGGAIKIMHAYSWLLFSPLIYWVIKFGYSKKVSVMHFVGVHLATCLIYFFAKAVNDLLVCSYFKYHLWPYSPLWERLFNISCRQSFPFNLFVYLGLLGCLYALVLYKKYQDRELRAARLEAQLSNAQLQMINLQLNPHFLFNSLNGISTLIHKDPKTADRMISRLSELLRSTLSQKGKVYVSLAQELDSIQRYLELEKMRFGDRLSFEMEIDSAAKDAKIPCMLLQPLIENAVKHGIAKVSRPGLIRVQSWVDDNTLTICIDDNGPGFDEDETAKSNRGIGQSNCQERLRLLYANQFQFAISTSPLAGARITISIPYEAFDANVEDTAS
jgi:two-component system, LytTR family, sensor kinase